VLVTGTAAMLLASTGLRLVAARATAPAGRHVPRAKRRYRGVGVRAS
jgi:hypothetical protein